MQSLWGIRPHQPLQTWAVIHMPSTQLQLPEAVALNAKGEQHSHWLQGSEQHSHWPQGSMWSTIRRDEQRKNDTSGITSSLLVTRSAGANAKGIAAQVVQPVSVRRRDALIQPLGICQGVGGGKIYNGPVPLCQACVVQTPECKSGARRPYGNSALPCNYGRCRSCWVIKPT